MYHVLIANFIEQILDGFKQMSMPERQIFFPTIIYLYLLLLCYIIYFKKKRSVDIELISYIHIYSIIIIIYFFNIIFFLF